MSVEPEENLQTDIPDEREIMPSSDFSDLLQRYRTNSLPQRERESFERISIRTGNDEGIEGTARRFIRHHLSHIVQPIDLISEFERDIKDWHEGRFSPQHPLFAEPLLWADPSDAAFAQICESVRRFFHFQKAPLLVFRKEPWEQTRCRECIVAFNETLKAHLGSSRLLEIYDKDYAGKPYDEIRHRSSLPPEKADVLEKQTQHYAGGQEMDWITARNILPIANRAVFVKILEFTGNLFAKGILEGNRDILLQECIANLNSFPRILEAVRFFERFSAVFPPNTLERCIETVKRKAEAPYFFRKLFLDTLISPLRDPTEREKEIRRMILEQIPQEHPEVMVNAFFEETDVLSALLMAEALPHRATALVLARLFGQPAFWNDPKLRTKAAILLRVKKAAFLENLEGFINHQQFPSLAVLDKFFSEMEEIFDIAGFSEDEERNFQTNIQSANNTRLEREKADRERIRAAARSGAHRTVAVSEKNGAVKSELSHDQYISLMEAALNGMDAGDLERRAPSLVGFRAILRSEVAEIVSSELLWEGGENEIEIPCEPESFLARLGIKAIRVRRSSSVDVDFVFEIEAKKTSKKGNGNGTPPEESKLIPYDPGCHVDNEGHAEIGHLPPGKIWLKDIIEAEILRLIFEFFENETMPRADLETLLVLLGLKEADVTPPPSPEPAPVPAEAPKAMEEPVDPRLAAIRAFLDHNAKTFDDFRVLVGDSGIKLPPGNVLEQAFFELQARIAINKQIDPGGIRIQFDGTSHQLAQSVPAIDFYSVKESREILKALGISAAHLHVREELISKETGEIDMYFGRVHVRFGDEIRTVHIGILPPHFDVCILGVDSDQIINDKDENGLAFLHAALEAFRMAVMREYDPQKTRPALPGGGQRNPALPHIDAVIQEIARGAFPVLVVDWKRTPGSGSLEEETDEEEILSGAGGSRTHRALPVKGKGKPGDVFEDLYTRPGTFESALASRGVFLTAKDCLRLFPALAGRFPKDAFRYYPDDLKKEFEGVFVPLEEPVVQQALQTLQSHFILSLSGAQVDLNNISAAIRTNAIVLDPVFARACRELFQNPNSAIFTYKDLFAEVSKKFPGVSQQVIFKAFSRMSILNPERMFIALSGATDYRLPHFFPKAAPEAGGALPFVFKKADYSHPPSTPKEVVAVIDGSRASIEEMNRQEWIRCAERGPAMDFAAGLQNQWRRGIKRPEISLEPRARAMIMWEFDDGTHAFSYLDAARDAVQPDLTTMRAEDRLLNIFPRVRAAVAKVLSDTISGNHDDFTDLTRWNSSELQRLEQDGVVRLDRDTRGRVARITPLKNIVRKKVVVFRRENIGYRQFRVEPTNMADYLQWLHANNALPAGMAYDPQEAAIQKTFYDILQF